MRLSVIVPVYDMAGDDKLIHCLDSLIAQTLPDGEIEIIAVDDCSADDSYAIICDYARAYPGRFAAYRCPENLHQGGAKNLGLAYAHGEWIGFIDADDWVVPDYYERLLSTADETGADMVGCDYSLVDEYTYTPGRIVHNNTQEQTGRLDRDKYAALLLDTGSLVVKIYRRYIIFGEGGDELRVSGDGRVHVFPEKIFYEDNAVSNTWMLRARHFEYIPEPLYFYYQHDGSTVHTISKKNLCDRMDAGRLLLSEARSRGYIDDYRDEIEFLYTVLFYINTLFSAMPYRMRVPGRFGFTHALAREIKGEFPRFTDNRYYRERIHPEEQRLIAMQMKSHTLFYIYYRLLWFYRDMKHRNK